MPNGIDKVMAFNDAENDAIDVSAIDAIPGSGNDAFTSLIGSAALFTAAGQFRVTAFVAGAIAGIPGAGYTMEFNTDSDKDAELTIHIQTADLFKNADPED